jgi:hypothetical protein
MNNGSADNHHKHIALNFESSVHDPPRWLAESGAGREYAYNRQKQGIYGE